MADEKKKEGMASEQGPAPGVLPRLGCDYLASEEERNALREECASVLREFFRYLKQHSGATEVRPIHIGDQEGGWGKEGSLVDALCPIDDPRVRRAIRMHGRDFERQGGERWVHHMIHELDDTLEHGLERISDVLAHKKGDEQPLPVPAQQPVKSPLLQRGEGLGFAVWLGVVVEGAPDEAVRKTLAVLALLSIEKFRLRFRILEDFEIAVPLPFVLPGRTPENYTELRSLCDDNDPPRTMREIYEHYVSPPAGYTSLGSLHRGFEELLRQIDGDHGSDPWSLEEEARQFEEQAHSCRQKSILVDDQIHQLERLVTCGAPNSPESAAQQRALTAMKQERDHLGRQEEQFKKAADAHRTEIRRRVETQRTRDGASSLREIQQQIKGLERQTEELDGEAKQVEVEAEGLERHYQELEEQAGKLQSGSGTPVSRERALAMSERVQYLKKQVLAARSRAQNLRQAVEKLKDKAVKKRGEVEELQRPKPEIQNLAKELWNQVKTVAEDAKKGLNAIYAKVRAEQPATRLNRALLMRKSVLDRHVELVKGLEPPMETDWDALRKPLRSWAEYLLQEVSEVSALLAETSAALEWPENSWRQVESLAESVCYELRSWIDNGGRSLDRRGWSDVRLRGAPRAGHKQSTGGGGLCVAEMRELPGSMRWGL